MSFQPDLTHLSSLVLEELKGAHSLNFNYKVASTWKKKKENYNLQGQIIFPPKRFFFFLGKTNQK